MYKISGIFILIVLFTNNVKAQLKPGFDWQEYHDLFILCMKNFYPRESKDLPEPADFKLTYSSAPMGLDNKWQLYIHHSKPLAAISIMGTSAAPESWIANYYSAMIPAKGVIKLNKEKTIDYSFANHPSAAVHAGWAVCALSLANDILFKIDSLYKKGIKNFYVTGHSQGGALSTLITAYLMELQINEKLPKDIYFKNYASASPKPGNEYFAHDYKLKTSEYGAFNVVNVDDWVPQTFITVQKLEDFNRINIFKSFEEDSGNASLLKRIFMNRLYKKVRNPLNKAQRRYEKYFGNYIFKQVKNYLPELEMPDYFHSTYYIAAAHVIPMQGEPDTTEDLPLMHFHGPKAYYKLILENLRTP